MRRIIILPEELAEPGNKNVVGQRLK